MYGEVEKDIIYILEGFFGNKVGFDYATSEIVFYKGRMNQTCFLMFNLTKLTTGLDIAKYGVVTDSYDSPVIKEMYDFYGKVFLENRINNWKSIIRVSRYLGKDFFIYFYKNFIRNKTVGTREREIYLKYFITKFRN